MVGTKEAAEILSISQRRLVTLLNEGRIHGAYKIGKIWAIPLVNGEPVIEECKHGPEPKWKRTKRLPALTQIHINRQLIGKKDSQDNFVPVISVKNGSENIYSDRVVIPGPCVVIYDYNNKNCSGAKAWIETYIKPMSKDAVDGILLENPMSYGEINARIQAVA